jgi:hypothetical protein
MARRITLEECPCCHTCLSPGLATEMALVAAFLGGVAARHHRVSIEAALCARHTQLATEAIANMGDGE